MTMFGVMREAPYCLDRLELERETTTKPSSSSAASKIPKSDALSIYEATLRKLRLGSRRVFGTSSQASAAKVERTDASADAVDQSNGRSRQTQVNLNNSVAINVGQEVMRMGEPMECEVVHRSY